VPPPGSSPARDAGPAPDRTAAPGAAADADQGGGPPSPIRVVVVDDHPIVRQGLVSVLDDADDLKVAGAAGSAAEALRLVRALQPDVVLLDLEMPELDGVQAIPQLLALRPDLAILVFTAYDTDERVLGAVRAGARGYLLKGASADEIARGIRTVFAGSSYLEPRVARTVLAAVQSPAPRAETALSAREREVLRLVADGLPTKQIARSLSITERTVKFHVTSIFQKLGADNRAQAVALAAQRGLL
jgi:DNA-binding NarL/FixJ family response regulator